MKICLFALEYMPLPYRLCDNYSNTFQLPSYGGASMVWGDSMAGEFNSSAAPTFENLRTGLQLMGVLKVAVQGCCHGELDNIYRSLSPAVELLIITGDFQALRNKSDLQTINVPPKYRSLGDFHSYYTGKKKASVMTVFIGGNHECSSYLTELKYGGWVAPNIYYIGDFGSVWYKGVLISGISGIYNPESLIRSHAKLQDEKLPYNPSTIRSVYHIKTKNFLKMYLLNSTRIALSHDWPQYVYNYGDLTKLLKQKPFFRDDVNSGKLGNPLAKTLLNHLKPEYWFSSHLHVKFQADITENIQSKTNSEEIDLDMDSMDVGGEPDKTTHFLALDKCGRHRKHLQILDIPTDDDHISKHKPGLYHNKRSIIISKIVEEYSQTEEWRSIPPSTIEAAAVSIAAKLQPKIEEQLSTIEDTEVPLNFEIIAPGGLVTPPLQYWPNNQTLEFCSKFNIPI